MVTEPELLLLDEPTANLDPVSTARVEQLIARVIGELQTTVIMATHDMAQGQRLADRIGVLIGGSMLQVGNPNEVFNLPNTMQVARFVGVENLLEGTVASREEGMVNVRIGGHLIEGVSDVESRDRGVRLHQAGGGGPGFNSSPPQGARNTYRGTIVNMAFTGPLARVSVDCGFPLVSLITTRSAQEMGLKEGAGVCRILQGHRRAYRSRLTTAWAMSSHGAWSNLWGARHSLQALVMPTVGWSATPLPLAPFDKLRACPVLDTGANGTYLPAHGQPSPPCPFVVSLSNHMSGQTAPIAVHYWRALPAGLLLCLLRLLRRLHVAEHEVESDTS